MRSIFVREKTDQMMAEFDKLKDDMKNNVSVWMGQKRRSEDELNRLVKEFDDFKA